MLLFKNFKKIINRFDGWVIDCVIIILMMEAKQFQLKIHNKLTDINQQLLKQFENVFWATLDDLIASGDCKIASNRDHNLTSEIESYFLKLAYGGSDDSDNVIVVITNLVAKYVMAHRLIDGNKRLSLMLMVNWLYLCGYRVDPNLDWAKIMIDNVVKMSSNYGGMSHIKEIIRALAIKLALVVKVDHFTKWYQYDQTQIKDFVKQNYQKFNKHVQVLKFN